jgi:acetate CoA/acetoacetate CoA-transferase beta subunit
MKERLDEDVIAMRAAKELKPGDCCNLGLGLPQLCAMYVPDGVRFETENGALGYGPLVTEDNWQEADYGRVDAGARFFTDAPGMSYFDFLTSFAMIRSGRLYSVLGGLQVSEKGDLANHSMGGDDIYLMIGGAMDLAWGAKKVIVAMTHTTKDGKPKIVRELTLPATARHSVDMLVTDIAVMEVSNTGIVLKETAPGWSVDEIQALTEPRLIISPDIKEMEL